jgi:carbamoyl-phosphate synthase large subunit
VLADLGFSVVATDGTAATLREAGIQVSVVEKAHQSDANTVEMIRSGQIHLVITTVESDPRAIADSFSMRRAALQRGIPYCTTMAAARASAEAIQALRQESIGVRSLQEIHARMRR